MFGEKFIVQVNMVMLKCQISVAGTGLMKLHFVTEKQIGMHGENIPCTNPLVICQTEQDENIFSIKCSYD